MENNQKLEELKNILENDWIILVVTDTIWWISCLANSEIAINKINNVKNRDESKNLMLLVCDKNMLERYVKKEVVDKLPNFDYPTTILYNLDQLTKYTFDNISPKLIKEDKAIRVLYDNESLKELIEYMWSAILTTSANISWNPSPEVFEDIDNEIINSVDYIYHIEWRKPKAKPSNIVKIDWDQIIYIRK